MPTVEGIAPLEPNVFADGSASLPKTLCWSGIFYPGRVIPFTNLEHDLMQCNLTGNGDGEALAAVNGPHASSTRAELGAMLGAALTPYPAHVGMDNISVVRRTDRILQGLPIHPFRPWQLLPDGHLWKALADVIASRGEATFKVSWVKGHAKDMHVQKGITTDWLKQCNARADATAEQGQSKSHPDGLRKLGHIYCNRQSRYIDLVKYIHQVIIQTHIEERRLRDIIAKNSHHPALGKKQVKWYLIPTALKWGRDEASTNFSLQHVPLVCPTICGSTTLYKESWLFLNHIRVEHASRDNPGITWVELLGLFAARGGHVDLRGHDATPASTKTTLPQITRAFKYAVKLVIRDTGNVTLRKYFGPATGGARRL